MEFGPELVIHSDSKINATYDSRPYFQHLDTREPFERGVWPNEGETLRGHRVHTMIVDEVCGINYEELLGSFNRWWNTTGQYEFSINGNTIEFKNNKAPDFGEFSPSQELNDFVNTLIQGE